MFEAFVARQALIVLVKKLTFLFLVLIYFLNLSNLRRYCTLGVTVRPYPNVIHSFNKL